ncbi:MAG: AAA family ATPase [Gaiellaceae bacterium]
MARSLALPAPEEAGLLAQQWRVLARAATFVAFLTSPAVFVYLHKHQGWSIGWSILGALVLVAAFRGFIDLVLRRFIPWPSLFGTDDRRMREEDIVNRRRAWFWRGKWRWVRLFLTIVVVVILYRALVHGWGAANPWQAFKAVLHWPGHIIHSRTARQYLPLALLLPFYFIFNFAILMGPLLLMGISQIRGFEPGDAEWGVKLDDVRGQAEAKEEVRRVVSLWQSGELFEKAGGKRERGLLFLGAPGTGKTMLAKAIATGFNSPFISIPGSGFAQTFIGIDAVIVRFLARKAKKLAAKWGGQCIVFIDEIDAVGRRRAGVQGMMPPSLADFLFFGDNGALNPSGDMLLETRAWRDKLFDQRAPERRSPYPAWMTRMSNVVNQAFPGGMMGGGGQLALNQLLITMDGIDNPPFLKRVITNRVNTLLDASYIIPRRIGRLPLRLPAPGPRGDQIYFIGATNIPIDQLDPALTRPGRMGRHVWFRTPTKQDRLDIFDLYLAKVDHDDELDRPARRDEIARITSGYSPAMVEQVCSLALTYSHHQGRGAFEWEDLVEAMTTLESGTAIGIDYVPGETRAVAIHEAGHAVAGHVYLEGRESTRLSIRMRGNALGHHQALDKEERFSRFRSEEIGILIWGLGAMAAEHVFYGENTNGVGGDLFSVTAAAAYMVGASGMGPERIELVGPGRLNGQPRRLTADEQRKEIMRKFEEIGVQIMSRANLEHSPVGGVIADRDKRRLVAQIIGQAYMKAYHLILHNKSKVEHIADIVVEKKELYGDELVRLLNGAHLEIPVVDLTDEKVWPVL